MLNLFQPSALMNQQAVKIFWAVIMHVLDPINFVATDKLALASHHDHQAAFIENGNG